MADQKEIQLVETMVALMAGWWVAKSVDKKGRTKASLLAA